MDAGRLGARLASRRGILAIHLLSLALGGLYLVRVNRRQWFFGDEWEFLGGARRTHGWLDQLLTPHNEHWSTAPYLIYRLLEQLFGIRSYWPYIGLAILLHLVVVHLVWRLMLQARIEAWIATVVVLPLIVLGAGAQNLLWAFQIGFLGSVALGLGVVLLANHDGAWRGRDWLALALALLALPWSGVSVLFIGVGALVALLRRGIRQAALLAVPPAVVYVIWAVSYPPPTNLAARSADELGVTIWPYIATGLSAAADGFTLNAPLLGSVLLVALAVWLVRTAGLARTGLAAVYALALGAVAQFALSAYGRAKLGVGQAGESRYGYIAIVMLAPAVALAADRLVRGRRPSVHVVFVAIFLALSASNAHLLRVEASNQEAGEIAIRGLVVAGARIAADRSQEIVADARPEPRYSPDITVDDLRRFARDGELPGDAPSPERTLTVAANLQVSLRPTSGQPACAMPPVTKTTVVHTGPKGVRVFVYGSPQGLLHVTLVDPSTGASGQQRIMTLPSDWNELLITRANVDATLLTPPNVHVCAVEPR